MRIAVVSAHYPPNFVSGGTLVPQRLARGLAGRGHTVGVFAGWLDLDGTHPERRPLSELDETDDASVAIRWVVTTPYIGWSDERNFSNPPVTERFRDWLESFRPDVVHFHALQSVGADLVPAAARHGARVVVTMHDFWWCCARQFLVDRDDQPCSLVVDAGRCPCEAGRDALADRNRRLRLALDSADVVLAPSASAAEVLAANGLAPDRLRVDENGLPEADASPPGLVAAGPGAPERAGDQPPPTIGTAHEARSPAAPVGPEAGPPAGKPDFPVVVRFTYAGGHSTMKGAHILTDAARRMARRRPVGWRLTAYGLGPHLESVGANLAGQPVTVADPYRPEELSAVLDATDVLVLPSVMRESHSILSREALARGVPVITSDSLGPEEVVRSGINGLVIPSADAEALAAAMVRFVDEPDLLAGLRAGAAGQPVPIRRLSEQVAGLEALYADLLAAPVQQRPAAGRCHPIHHVVFMVGIEGAPLRYRARLPAEGLALLGITSDVLHYRDAGLHAAIDRADALVVYRVPATVQVRSLVDRARGRPIPVLFDVDDLIFDPDLAEEIPALRILPAAEAALWLEGVRRYRTTMEQADGFVGSTPALVAHAETTTGLPAARFDNGVGLLLGQRSDAELRRPRAAGPVRIGYLSGSTTHDEDWFSIEPAVIRVLDANPDVELWLGGHLPESPALEPYQHRVRRIPFTPWFELPAVLRDLDVNLAPLAPGSRFNEAKSAIKWLEAALTATPTVASPTEPFRDAVVDGANGFLASDPDVWFARIHQLVNDRLLRQRLGTRARRDALLRWSPHVQARRYLEILEGAGAWREAGRSAVPLRAPWSPVEHDEPMVDHHPLEPYRDGAAPRPGPAGDPSPGRAAKARHLAGTVRRSVRQRGVMATARRGPAFLRRRLRRRFDAWRDRDGRAARLGRDRSGH